METPRKTWERTKTPGLLRHRGGRYYGRFTIASKTKFVPLETDTLEVARRRFADHKALVERTRKAARQTENGTANMGALLHLYRERVQNRADVAERTRARYLEHASFIEKTWPGFASLRPDEITRSDVEQWRNRALTAGTGYRPPGAKETTAGRGRSPGSYNKAVDALRRLLDIAVERGALHANPLAGRGIKAKDTPRKPRLPDREKLHAVFAEIERGSGKVGGWGKETADYCRFLAFTGCRQGEANAVTWADVDFTRAVLFVRGTKTEAATREVPLIPAAKSLLEAIRERRLKSATVAVDGVPQIDAASRVLGVSEASRSLARACAAVGVDRLTHHDLRDAFATTCIESSVDIPTVAAWLGHADGGALLMRVYAHHRRAHSVAQAAKVDFGGAA